MRVWFCRVALDRAAVLLRMKKEIVRLDNVWGVGGGQRPVKHLIKEVKSQQTGRSSDGRRESRNACCLGCRKSLCQHFSVLRNRNCNNKGTDTHPELQCSCSHEDYNHVLKIYYRCTGICLS